MFMFIFAAHSSQVSYSINSQFVGPGGWGVKGSEPKERKKEKKKKAVSLWITEVGSMFSVSCKSEVGVRLG